MFHEDKKSSDDYQRALAEARGTDQNLTQKIEWLQKKWKDKKYEFDGEAAPMMYSILFSQTQPIHTSVVADNLTYFEENYKYDTENIELFLMEACLCGSRNIAEYLMKQIKSSYKDRPDLLFYIATSMNMEWAKEVALSLAQEKLPMPKDVYRLADGQTINTIIEIFKAEANQLSGTSNPLIFTGEGNSNSLGNSTTTANPPPQKKERPTI